MSARPTPFLVLVLGLALVACGGAAGSSGAVEAPVPVVRYGLEIRILPEEHRLEAKGTVHLPATAGPRDSILFKLNPQLGDLRVEVLAPAASRGLVRVRRGEGGAWIVRPASAFPADHEIELRVSYAGGGADPSGFFYIGPEVSFGYADWYPVVPGLRGMGTLLFDVPQGDLVTATGTPGLRHIVFVSSVPSEFSFATGRFTLHERPGAVPVRAYVLRTRPTMDSLMTGSLAALAVLEKEFGEYPYGDFTLVEIPTAIAAKAGNVGAFAIDGGMIARSTLFDQPFNLAGFAHEIAHLWWGHLVQHTGTRGDYMLDEGLAQFGALRAVEELEGPAAAERFRRTGVPGFNADLYSGLGYLKLAAAGLDHRLADLPDSALSYWIAYSKAGLVWDQLSRTIGRDRFRQALHGITRDDAFRDVTWEHFLAAVTSAPGQDANWFAEQWFEQAGAPEWTLAWTQKGNSIAGSITQSPPFYRARLEVEATGAKGERVVREIEVREGRTEFRLDAPFRATAVTLDPHFLVLHWTPEYRAEAAALADYTRASYMIRDGKLDAAGQLFEQALARLSSSDPPYSERFLLESGLARVLIAQKRWPEARRHLEAAIADPSPRADLLPTVWLRLATVAGELRDDKLFSRAVAGAMASDARVGDITGAGIAARDLAAAWANSGR